MNLYFLQSNNFSVSFFFCWKDFRWKNVNCWIYPPPFTGRAPNESMCCQKNRQVSVGARYFVVTATSCWALSVILYAYDWHIPTMLVIVRCIVHCYYNFHLSQMTRDVYAWRYPNSVRLDCVLKWISETWSGSRYISALPRVIHDQPINRSVVISGRPLNVILILGSWSINAIMFFLWAGNPWFWCYSCISWPLLKIKPSLSEVIRGVPVRESGLFFNARFWC